MSTHAFPSNPFTSPFNPFLPHEDVVEVEEDGAEAREYALVATGPAVSADEVESHLEAIEVKVRWGTQILAVHHLGSKKGFSIGEGGDFTMPELALTSLVNRIGSAASVSVPEGATASVRRHGGPAELVGEMTEITLGEGTSVSIELGAVIIDIAAVRAGKKAPVGFMTALASGAAACIGLSFVGHAAIVATLAMFMPRMSADDAEAITRDQTLTMKALLDASAEREQEQIKDNGPSSESAAGSGQPGGEPHKGESGLAGTTKPTQAKGHMGFKGNDSEVRLSRTEELQQAGEFGFIGMLHAPGNLTGPTSPWSTDTQLGMDPDNKLGALFGATLDDAMGNGGLGLYGTGLGGGGKGQGVGIDGVGNLVGNGRCTGPGPCPSWGGRGDKQGMGISTGVGLGGHTPKGPQVRPEGKVDVNGRLPPEVIQRIVRQNNGRFRLCYEAGLRNNPALTGRVVTKFTIGRDGGVGTSQDAGSDLADQNVVSCIVRSFAALSFPEPQGGVATVIYPISLTPGE